MFFFNYMIELRLWKPGFPQGLFCPWVIVKDSVFQHCVQQRLEQVHGSLQGPQLGLRAVCLLPGACMSETPPGSLACGAGSHGSYNVLLSLDELLSGEGAKQGMSYFVLMLMSFLI